MNRLIVQLTLNNGAHYTSDPTKMDEDDVTDVMSTLKDALSGEAGVFLLISNGKTVLIRNDAIMSASFEYREDDEDAIPFAGV